MRILHTSDWHIGRQFHNVSLLDDQRFCLNQLIEILSTEKIDLLVIAGDIYDRSVPPADAVVLLHQTLSTINIDLKIPTVVISGNHDGPERLGFAADLLKASGLFILTDISKCEQAVKIEKDGETVNVFAIPYCQPEHVRDRFNVDVKTFDEAHTFLVDRITDKMDNKAFNLLMSHCFVDGGQQSESERPLSIGGAETVKWQPMAQFDYVALGHLHAPQYRGEKHIRYSGSLMKYSFSEVSQLKAVTIIETEDNKVKDIQIVELKQQRDLRVIEALFDDIIKNGFDDKHKDDYLLIRITDTDSVIDAIGKLRLIYPNILQLEKTATNNVAFNKNNSKLQLKRNEIELFKEFYEQTLDKPLTDEQTTCLQSIVKDIYLNQVES
ncbi:MAG: exonuclease SbcCD subunit D [Saccharospirillaceae bacterium]|nr:exonuclease SbcCD subunit D [Pseudomonadales bacterium]NRB80431.1 exonuclease SbcCD subunit D [Saccharospirillaceae bacterium]